MKSRVCWCALAAVALACGGDDDEPLVDAGSSDVGQDDAPMVDAGPPETIEDLPIDEERALPGLGASVDAVRDERGMWHIYAESLDDGLRAMGYLQARDRMGQLEFIRRAATGRLGEFAGSLQPSLIEDDVDARVLGYARIARQLEEEATGEERELLDRFQSFADGITARIDELRDGEELPRAIRDVLPVELFDDWTLNDMLSIARFQSASLSYDGNDDISRTSRLASWQAHFTSDATDPRISRLAFAHHDLHPTRPAARVYNREGFPNIDTDGESRALLPPTRRPRPNLGHLSLPSERALARAAQFTNRIEATFVKFFGDDSRGSNSWIVSGEHTESGAPIMSNDPHLALTSPPLFWQAHLNTKRAGGELDVAGQMIAGTPAILLGFNDHIAWGLTTSAYDVTDTYQEEVTFDSDGNPVSVLFRGEQVPVEVITEVVLNDLGVEREVKIYRVPHHGTLIPDTLDPANPSDAISIRWTGDEPTNEGWAFYEISSAETVEEARDAFHRFEVGNQTLAVVDRAGDIYYTSHARIPLRDPNALSYDISDYSGASPCMVLDGTSGDFEWDGFMDDRYIPHDLNPAKGFTVTANADPVGVTDDNDPHNDPYFLGCWFENGWRQQRITERIEELIEAGAITPQDMSALQNDALSPWGRSLTPTIVADLARALEERDSPGTHADLEDLVSSSSAAMDTVAAIRDRLMAWGYDTPAAVEGSPSEEEIDESIATSIFNVILPNLMFATFDDEFDWLADGEFNGNRRRTGEAEKTLYWMIHEPTSMVTFDDAFDPDGDGNGDSVLWDDISTDDVESRAHRVLTAVLAAIDTLESQFGTDDMEQWRWGKLHTIRLDALVPVSIVGSDPISIPTPDDEMFPDGFPRHGDRDVVDAASFSIYSTRALDYGSGPQQRLVVEMTPDGPNAWNALPGGNSEDPDSPYHHNEMELWRTNQAPPVAFREADVLSIAASRIRLNP